MENNMRQNPDDFNSLIDKYTNELQKYQRTNQQSSNRRQKSQPRNNSSQVAQSQQRSNSSPPTTQPTQPTQPPQVKSESVKETIPAVPMPTVPSKDTYTSSVGTPIDGDTNSVTVGSDGPVLLEDIHLIDKLAHFDRERIPERVVHAKGVGAFGSFKCYNSMSKYTAADFLSEANKVTPVFVRFSTVIGSKGSADTARDPRGFAVKFYTKQGNYDITGNNIPVFFIRDAIKFPDVIHSLKPSPRTNTTVPERFWDFISLSPEATHMIVWLYSDNGTIKSYRHTNGFGVNTYVWINSRGKRIYVKYHWITQQGLQTIDRHEATYLAGANPDVAVKDLQKAISIGSYPKYELCVQMMELSDVEHLDFDPLDDTKVWDEEKYPLIPVGMMTLNQNPDNFFAQVEQAAFCPSNLVPGIELSADKMLQGRSFSYKDTQRHRLGVNFEQLPINRSIAPVFNNERDGQATYTFNKSDINYSPNSLNDNKPEVSFPAPNPSPYISGNVGRIPIENGDDFKQAGEKYRSYTKTEQEHLVDNIAVELQFVRADIRNRVIGYFTRADQNFGAAVTKAVEKYMSETKRG